MLKMAMWMLLIVPGAICAYAFVLRPVLAAMPQFKKFYAEADGFWAKVWAVCGKSATMAWSYLLAGIGVLVQFIDPLAAALGDPDLHNQVTNALASDPKILGYFAMAVAAITLASRLRTIGKS